MICETLSHDQLSAVYEKLSASSFLKELTIERNNHANVSLRNIVTTLTKLEKLEITGFSLESIHLNIFATKVFNVMKHLDLGCTNLTRIPSELLIIIITKVEFIQLRWHSLTLEQKRDIANMFSEKKTGKLKVIRILIPPIIVSSTSGSGMTVHFSVYSNCPILITLLRDLSLLKLYERIKREFDGDNIPYLEIKI